MEIFKIIRFVKELKYMVKNTPAMGWNSWNTFGENINEEVVLKTAETLIKSGLKDAGYEYVVIDDCWSLRERDKNGKLVADPEKFPHGIKWLSDKIHAMGLKFGMYSCAGVVTCAGYPSSYEHEFVDAKTFADWGVDYLKYDYCFRSLYVPGSLLYKRMNAAIMATGRDILFSACSWGEEGTHEWVHESGADSYRSTMDIWDNWVSIKDIFQSQLTKQQYNYKGCFNDMDMLVVGMRGKGNVARGLGGCTDTEYFTHFALWCMYASPLMLGNDVNNMDEETLKIVTNKDLIRINQDKRCCQPFLINRRDNSHPELQAEMPIIAKYLDDGKIAIMLCNFTDGTTNRWNSWFLTESVGVPESSGKTLKMRDIMTNEETVVINGLFTTPVEPHGVKVYIAEIIDK